MMYFVQFYQRESLMWDRSKEVTVFKNGFSSIWNRLSNLQHGPIIWMDADSEESDRFGFPNGIAYVSVYYKDELFKVLKWAKDRPDVEFHVGGPIIDTWPLSKKIEESLPNFKSHHKALIETVLFQQKIAPPSHWNLRLPDHINASDIAYGFSISKNNGCWWRRCTFCKQKTVPTYLNCSEIPIIDYPGTKHIWINTYCIRPRDIKNIYPNLPNRDDVRYATYLKLNRSSMRALAHSFYEMKCNPNQLAFNVGIDCPSDRILKIFNRGVCLSDYIEGLNFLLYRKCKIHINLIFRLGFLQKSDIDDVKLFADGLSHSDLSNLSASIYRLHISPERPLWDYLIENGVFVTPSHNHVWEGDLHIVKMNDEQMKLDEQMYDIYKSLNMSSLISYIPEGE
jgi:hypothetical protein